MSLRSNSIEGQLQMYLKSEKVQAPNCILSSEIKQKERTSFPQREAVQRLRETGCRFSPGEHNNNHIYKVPFNPVLATHLSEEQSLLIT